jgi:hypothetical protein
MGAIAKKIKKSATQADLTYVPQRFASLTSHAPSLTFCECFAKIC